MSAQANAVKAAQSVAFFQAYGVAVRNYSAGSTNRGCYPADFAQSGWNPADLGSAPVTTSTGGAGSSGATAVVAQASKQFYAPPTVLGQVCAGTTPPPCCAPTT